MAIANNWWGHRYYILSLFSFGNEYVYFRDKRKLNPEQQAVLDKIVGCAGDILATGDMDIYQRTYEQLRLALAPKKVGNFYLNFHYYWFILYSYVFEHIPTEALKNPIGKINKSTKYFFFIENYSRVLEPILILHWYLCTTLMFDRIESVIFYR